MLPKLLETYPGLDISLRLEDRAADLIVEGVDIAVRAGMVLPNTLHLFAQSIATFRAFVVVSPAYIERHGLPLQIDSLTAHAAIVGPDSSQQWRFVEGKTERTIPLTPKLRIGTLLGQLTAVRAGLGLAVLPDFVVEEDLRRGTLQAIRFAAELAPVVVYALVRADARKIPRIRAVVEHLAQTVPLGLGE
jgi:DNA-binding transcriptional LysR family regulator